MKDHDLIASSGGPTPRANPMIWEGEEAAEGVFLGVAGDDPLALLGTPTLDLPEMPRLPEDFVPSGALRDWLQLLQDALADAGDDAAAIALPPLESLVALDCQAIVEILGEGEVNGSVSLDGVDYRITESVLPGIWRLEGSDGSHRVEVGALPMAVTAAADSLEIADYAVPAGRDGLMNAPAVLAEIRDRARAWAKDTAESRAAGEGNHVINFTLMPMSDLDHEALRGTLGRAELSLHSGGFGKCRVYATRYRNIWAVQYLNALDATILDTLEIGEAPAAVRASREDFEDSGARLKDILEAYL
jgi:hydrogenase-1 operon protein HyaF